jgi:hypothetical protein
MWVYHDNLQIKFMFRSGPMIFGQVMALFQAQRKKVETTKYLAKFQIPTAVS